MGVLLKRRVARGVSATQAFLNRLVWDNGDTQVFEKPTRGIHYRMFTWFDPKVHLYLAIL
jgi:hypothetical protein